MKKLPALLLFILSGGATMAQQAADVFSASEITWFGLDFTQIKLRGQFTQVGSAGFKDERDIQDVYFEAWNNIVAYQPEKYNLSKTFRVGHVPYDLSMINKLNAGANVKDMFSSSSSDVKVNEETVKKMVGAYKTGKKSGIGCVFIMESFDKGMEQGAMWVTFFDMASGKVLFTERMVEKAGGFGLKNYWIRPVYNALNHIDRSQYRAWKNKYGK